MPGTPRNLARRACGKDRADCKLYFTVERGMSFPRCEKLIILLNGLEVSADAIFCDVLEHSTSYKSSELSEKLASLSPQAQKRILQMVELMIQQETADNG